MRVAVYDSLRTRTSGSSQSASLQAARAVTVSPSR